ncbi:MAG: hypothetical protein Q7T61_18530 [Caulobacter sp.]|nr:hypothetical protein [Caulobacter sp.]
MNRSALVRAILIGTALQLAMIIAGHFVPFIKDNVFMWGGMALSLVAGLLYAFAARDRLGPSLMGGGVAGAVCAVIGIGASVLLGDTPAFVLAVGTGMSFVTGLIGGGIGRMLAR